MRLVALALLFATFALSQHASQFAPTLKHKVEPKYTEEARQAHIQGTAVLYAVIGVDGRAHDIRVIRKLGYGLDEEAVACLVQWEFQPGLKDGEPTATPATIEIHFRLE